MASSAALVLLPEEIFGMIFEYLPVDDRKNVRLACRKFYDLTNSASLLRSEEIVIPGNLAVASIGALANSRRKIWNLKFVSVNLMADVGFLSFFQNQGRSVHSLTFDRCPVAVPGLMYYIIENCANLRSFAITADLITERRTNLNYVLDDFNLLCQNGIIRQYVSSFTLPIIECNDLINSQFFNLFVTFPNITELYLRCTDLLVVPHETHQFSFLDLHHQLVKMRGQLEKLSLNLEFGYLADKTEIHECWNKISLIEMENLRELSIDRFEFRVWDTLTPFIYFNHLTVLKCMFSDSILENNLGSDVIIHLLNTCTELYSLSIFSYSDFLLTEDCFRALVGSRLNTLICWRFVLNNSELFSLTLPPNYTLKRLKFPEKNESYILLFTKFFRSLEKLFVDTVNENILSSVFQYQTKLRRLTIDFSTSSLAFERWLNNTDSLSHRLNYLTRLKLYQVQSLELFQLFLIQFEFPKLRSFSFFFDANVEMNSNVGSFWQCIQNLTDLEFLDIGGGIPISPEQFSALCCSLSKLRCFIYVKCGLKPFEPLMYHELFRTSPSLRVIIHGDPESYSVKYFKDIGANTVIHVPWPREENIIHKFIYEEIPP